MAQILTTRQADELYVLEIYPQDQALRLRISASDADRSQAPSYHRILNSKQLLKQCCGYAS